MVRTIASYSGATWEFGPRIAKSIGLKGLQDGQYRADTKDCETHWWKAISADMTHALFSAKMIKELEKTP